MQYSQPQSIPYPRPRGPFLSHTQTQRPIDTTEPLLDGEEIESRPVSKRGPPHKQLKSCWIRLLSPQ